VPIQTVALIKENNKFPEKPLTIGQSLRDDPMAIPITGVKRQHDF
jgi:hypothetical protein